MVVKRYSPVSLIVIAIALVIAALILWFAIDIILLIFAGLLLALFFNGVASFLARKSKLPYKLVLILVVFTIAALFTLVFTIATPLIAKQLVELFDQIPQAYNQFRSFTEPYVGELFSKENIASEFIIKNVKIMDQIKEIFSFTVGGIIGFVIFLFIGIYTAYDPNLYRAGFLKLVPYRYRPKTNEVLDRLGKGFRYWLIAKLISMVSIGILTYIGLSLLHIPLAFILSLLSGLLTFIPYFGPIISAIPAILIALAISPLLSLYVLILYIGIQAAEGYLITPIIEKHTVFLPPSLTIGVQIILTILVGFLGLALASPITVLLMILVKEYWYSKKDRKKAFTSDK